MNKMLIPVLCFIFSGIYVFCDDPPPKPEDFAGAYELTGQKGGLLRLELPVEVFLGSERPDLGDLRIFNASGALVPYIIRIPPGQMVQPEPREIPFFVWKQGNEKTPPANTDIEINTSGGVVQIRNQSSGGDSSPVYLADLSALEQLPSELVIEADHGGNYFNTPVSLRYSADLSHWTAFDKKQILAFYGSAGANRDTLELPAAFAGGENFRYLLLGMNKGAPPPVRMEARFDPSPVPAGIREKSIAGEKSGDGKTIGYNTGGFYPLFEADFVLSGADSLQVEISSRYWEDEDWNRLGRETVYRFASAAGETQKNKAFPVSSSAPYWQLQALGERAFNEAPELVIRWKMRELVFLAQGEGPWTLAYGNAGCAPPEEGELPQLGDGDEGLLPALPTGLGRYEERKRGRIQEDHAYGVWLLWAVLILAAALLSALAFFIARSMKN
jgi:hypothetical protein